MLATRPKTLAGAAVPVLLGCALAGADGGFQTLPAVLCFLFAFLMQIDANLINDYYDYVKGADREDRLGPERAFAQGWISFLAMRSGIVVTTILACAVGCGLLWYGGWELVIVGVVCATYSPLCIAAPVWGVWAKRAAGKPAARAKAA